MYGLVTRSLVLVLTVIMPITRSYDTILRDIDKNVKLTDDCLSVQFKKRRAKKESVKTNMKNRMDLILRVIQKLQTCHSILVQTNEQYGNSMERQNAKEEMESQLVDLEQLTEFFSKF